jgi:hypothetical protein
MVTKSNRPTAGNQDYNGQDLKFGRCLTFGVTFEIWPVFDVCHRNSSLKNKRPKLQAIKITRGEI